MRPTRLVTALAAVAFTGASLVAVPTSASADVPLPEAWSSVGEPLPGIVYALTRYRGDLYAGGAFGTGLARWNPSTGTWEILGEGARSIQALATGPDGTLYSAGSKLINSVSVPFVAAWQGDDWKDIGLGSPTGPAPAGGWISSLAVGNDGRIYAGGLFTSFDGAQITNLAVFDGKEWSGPSGNVNIIGPVMALAVARGTVYVGAFLAVGDSYSYAASLSGDRWSIMPGMDYSCPGLNPCLGIVDLAVDGAGTVHAAGQFKIGETLAGYASWGGKAWVARPVGGMTIGTAVALDDAGIPYVSLGEEPGGARWMVARMGEQVSVLGDLGGRVGTYALIVDSRTTYAAFTGNPADPTAPWQVASFTLPAKASASAVPRNVRFADSHEGKPTLRWKAPAYAATKAYRVQYRLSPSHPWKDARVLSGERQARLPASVAGKMVDVRVCADGGYWITRTLRAPAPAA